MAVVLRKIAGDVVCTDGVSCPAVYADGSGTVVVQGYRAPAGELPAAPDGEARVRVPVAVLLEAARELADR